MNMTSLFHQFLKQAIALCKDNSGKAVARFKTLLNALVRQLLVSDRIKQTNTTHIVLIQRFLALQHLIARSRQAVLLHYALYPH